MSKITEGAFGSGSSSFANTSKMHIFLGPSKLSLFRSFSPVLSLGSNCFLLQFPFCCNFIANLSLCSAQIYFNRGDHVTMIEIEPSWRERERERHLICAIESVWICTVATRKG